MNAFENPPHKSRIGITPEGVTDDGQLLLPLHYLLGVQRACGVPVVLPPWDADAATLLDLVDGLLLAGGGDIAPSRYGSAGHQEIYGVDHGRDAGELALLDEAIRRGKPVFGICRGAQLINVALGGTLTEHLPDHTSQPHRAEPSGGLLHAVTVPAGSRLHSILDGAESRSRAPLTVEVMSWHHQAIDRVGNGLIATACAEDGTIEAIEATGAEWLVAVQWHPELTAASDCIQQRLFDAFVEACRKPVEAIA